MIFEILKNPMYSFLFVLTLVIFLVIFLWRKLTILESNFYILEKRVNLIKESKNVADIDAKNTKSIFGNMTDKNIERSNIVMKEIFGNIDRKCNKEDVTISFDTEKIINELDISNIDESDNLDNDNEKNIISDPIIEELDIKEEIIDFDNTSNASDFIFNAEEKYTQKKLSKLNMDKLKTICEKMNISTEGTKNQLISRILE